MVSHFNYILTEHQRCHWSDARKLLNDAHESTVYLACPKRPLRFKHFTFLPSNNQKQTTLPRHRTIPPHDTEHHTFPPTLHLDLTPSLTIPNRRFQNISCINDWVYPLNRCSAGMALSSLSLPLSLQASETQKQAFVSN